MAMPTDEQIQKDMELERRGGAKQQKSQSELEGMSLADKLKRKIAAIESGSPYAGDRAADIGSFRERLAREEGFSSLAQKQTVGDIERGRQLGRDIIGEEGLGRLGTDKDVQDVLARFKKQSETGMSSAESLARKEQAFQGIGQATQTAERQLLARLGSRGVRGAAAGAQLANLQVQGLQQRAQVQRDLYLEEEGLKRSGLKDFADALGQVKTFDLGQAAREKDIELSAGLGFTQMGSAERIAGLQATATAKAAAAQAAAACFGGNSLIKMADGSYRKIKDIEIGAETSHGFAFGKSQHLIPFSTMVVYEGIYVTKFHPVRENGVWMMAGESDKAQEVKDDGNRIGIYVYDLWVEGNRLEIKGEKGDVLFTDYEGTDEVENFNKELIESLNEQERTRLSVVSISSGKIPTKGNQEG